LERNLGKGKDVGDPTFIIYKKKKISCVGKVFPLDRGLLMGDPFSLKEDVVYLSSIYKGRYPSEEGLLPHGDRSKDDTERAMLSAKRFIERLKLLLD